MKLWIDDCRPAPPGYCWIKSVNEAIEQIVTSEVANRINRCFKYNEIELIDIDHDAGDYASNGGDYIKLLDWLEETGRSYPIRIHSQNPVGVENMRRIIQKNGWREVK